MSVSNLSGRQALPNGFEIRLRDNLIVADRGRLLVGGSPIRTVRLSSRARTLLADGGLAVDGPATASLARRLLDGNLAEPVLDRVEVSLADLTVIIPVRDRVEQLDRCLAALAPLQVIVVDDASEDAIAVSRVVRQHGARLVSLSRNLGPAGARNAGLAQVDTPLVAFVDSDVEAGAGALLDLARHCADPQLALVGPRVVGVARTDRPRWFERYDAAASSLDLGRAGGPVRPGAELGWLPSACLVGRTALLRGGFQDTWRVAEDVDFVWRLVDAGHVVRYDPTVEVCHDIRPSAQAWLGRKVLYGTGGASLAARHGDKVAPAVLSVPMAVGAAALLQRRWWSVPVAAAVVAATARSLRTRLPADNGTTIIAIQLAVRGLGWAVRQESSLLLRHWWPAAAVGAFVSRSIRRTLVTAVAVDLVLFLRERSGVGPLTALICRRLDDLAYGTGLWWGALRRLDSRCLAVRWVGGDRIKRTRAVPQARLRRRSKTWSLGSSFNRRDRAGHSADLR
ncbi:mycofactocin biosynthesis glycosyltransferase MftF [Arthrobacter mobilis]|uniref:Mycofactocin system glycosyltransferase n=1 Tax=Arthrobacter mobilis TaxID=2724944 RepID=A0A7X6K7H9_9MICC|nr:mycofactocin biosynthesis glycosyltransferase MftF [Arthrobacter mobilis]NKX56577.1 mycofactocin system glycosyltransferase [Arthrobacter mobilis]